MRRKDSPEGFATQALAGGAISLAAGSMARFVGTTFTANVATQDSQTIGGGGAIAVTTFSSLDGFGRGHTRVLPRLFNSRVERSCASERVFAIGYHRREMVTPPESVCQGLPLGARETTRRRSRELSR